MRIRTVKPEWLEDDRMFEASLAARVLSVALLLKADDFGNGRASRRRVVAEVFPPEHVEAGLQGWDELVAMEFLLLYEDRGQLYYTVRNWEKHQRVNHPGKPRVPGPSGTFLNVSGDPTETLGNSKGSSLYGTGKGSGNGEQGTGSQAEPDHARAPVDGSVPGSAEKTVPAGNSPKRQKRRAKSWPDDVRTEAENFVAWFNKRFDRAFEVRDPVLTDVQALLDKGFERTDMRVVALHRREEWRDTDNAKHLVPSTLLRMSNFEKYIDPAREWYAAGKRQRGAGSTETPGERLVEKSGSGVPQSIAAVVGQLAAAGGPLGSK